MMTVPTVFSPRPSASPLRAIHATPATLNPVTPNKKTQPSADTFTHISPKNAEQRSGINSFKDVEGAVKIIELLRGLGTTYQAVGLKIKQEGFQVLEFAQKEAKEATQFLLARSSSNKEALYFFDLRGKVNEPLISFKEAPYRNSTKTIQVQNIADGKGSIITREQFSPNQPLFVSSYRHPHLSSSNASFGKGIERSLSKNAVYQAAPQQIINDLFKESETLITQLFATNQTLL
jgi:hypothetical protein